MRKTGDLLHENLKERAHLEDKDVYGRALRKLILKE
jgi:hypothetical protein